ncbi:hypothetical protein Vlu01_36070 [Micromonospora lutea]|uniref:Uncharacterized protein n=1 Tax=Micromonospora lutea TaxID=419825 RepID=A0ABQ4IZ15_9ACTN|nr:hypothetical protein Vlu01_36070 [Micromonospora lutea]
MTVAPDVGPPHLPDCGEGQPHLRLSVTPTATTNARTEMPARDSSWNRERHVACQGQCGAGPTKESDHG